MFFPYSTERELQRTPWATITLIAVNVLVAILTFIRPDLVNVLAQDPGAFKVWQPVTALFTHAGIYHLAGNMLFLWVFGCHVEDTLGIPRYLMLYFSAGFAADVLQPVADRIFLGDMRPGLGASGAIMGLVALFATRYRKVKVNFFYWFYYFYYGTWQIAAIWVAIMYIGMDVLEGFGLGMLHLSGGTGNFAHIGGFLMGLTWAYAVGLPQEASVDEAADQAAAFAAGGAYEAAAAPLEAELQRQPLNPELHRDAARYLQIKPATRPRALEHWKCALGLCFAQGRAEEALEYWQEAGRNFSCERFEPQVLYQIAVLLERGGDIAGAAAAYDAIARSYPQFDDAPEATLRYADMMARNNQAPGARAWYEYIARTWPDSPQALEVPARLSRA